MAESTDLRVEPAATRIFTVDEANHLLKEIESAFHALDRGVARLREVRELIEDLERYYGEDLASAPAEERERHGSLWIEAQGLTDSMDEDVARINGHGCLVKDIAGGLVDFHGIVNDELVFLCWKRGEPRVAYYHPLTTGFPGRKPLPPPPG